MSKIKVMDEQLSNRIAAGEVIERPASVVKELVENAIDAGATHIRIEIERAGSRLISVSDNGSGMDADDALLCIEPHGTSKIFTAEDIDRITTLGFRGEALPFDRLDQQIHHSHPHGGNARGHPGPDRGGRLLEAAPAGCAAGTVMQVRDLFFNTPARKSSSNLRRLRRITSKRPFSGWRFPDLRWGSNCGSTGGPHSAPPAAPTPEARLRELFGRPFVENLWPVNHTESGITITGFTAAPGFTRNSRREQRTFVNGRAVESAAIYRGIRDGYATLTESGRYAPAVLFLTLAPEEVDVNVHPAKREIRFKHEFAVTRAVTAAIGNALKRSREVPPAQVVSESSLPLDGRVPLRLLLDSAGVHYQPKATQQPTLNLDGPGADREDALPDAAPTETLFLTAPPAGGSYRIAPFRKRRFQKRRAPPRKCAPEKRPLHPPRRRNPSFHRSRSRQRPEPRRSTATGRKRCWAFWIAPTSSLRGGGDW
ncbi:MAG: DNA mismatch repair endonuclease MutL [Lentisphaeria bacterium]|nr:MAG: DNA mismatch repair endonuclease MutL [Lentisphaeria bacterium]